MSVTLAHYLAVSGVIFGIGIAIALSKRNAIAVLMGVELMLNAVNINLVAFSRFHGTEVGMVFSLFAICITVAEVAIGLSLVILLFRMRRTAIADQIDWLKG